MKNGIIISLSISLLIAFGSFVYYLVDKKCDEENAWYKSLVDEEKYLLECGEKKGKRK